MQRALRRRRRVDSEGKRWRNRKVPTGRRTARKQDQVQCGLCKDLRRKGSTRQQTRVDGV